MPGRRKTSLSRSTSQSRRKQDERAVETEEKREARLATDRARHAAARAQESAKQREARLASARTRQAASRAGESEEERAARLADDREYHAASRADETEEDRTARLSRVREYYAASRADETEEDRAARLSRDREYHAASRADETEEDRAARLSRDREYHAASRADETEEDRAARLSRDREYHAASRAGETEEDRAARLSRGREYHAASRADETEEDRAARLSRDREYHAASRAHETEEDRAARLSRDREYHAASRADETEEDRAARLSTDRAHHSAARLAESQAERDTRRRSDRIRQAQRRSTLTEEEHSRILEARREDHARRQEQAQRQREERGQAARNRRMVGNDEDEAQERRPGEYLPWRNKEGSAYRYDPLINYRAETDVGPMNVRCTHCDALKWKDERAPTICCNGGKVSLPPLPGLPNLLKSLIVDCNHDQSRHFLEKTRAYNSAFMMTSFGAKEIVSGDDRRRRGFQTTFKVRGQVFHLIGSLLPPEGAEEQFIQLYFVADERTQATMRMSHVPNLQEDLVRQLQRMLHAVNPLVRELKTCLDTHMREEGHNIVIRADRVPRGEHPGRHNAPTVDEVAVIIVGQECERRDIVLRKRDGELKRISETHRSYDALQYPLMFPTGEDGYHIALRDVNPETGEITNRKMTPKEYYSYRLMVRGNDDNRLLRYRQLTNQYIVDMYAKVETERLSYLRTHQNELRVEEYAHLQDALRQDVQARDVGRPVILPSSFVGGPRYMHEKTQDAFMYVRKYGRPDLFITFTTNPKWAEIKTNLFQGQQAKDRHDLVSRVFKLKVKKLLELVVGEKVFGPVRCYMYSVEWQKRGLPHIHLLLWLEEKIRPNQIDDVISAELPDPRVDPELYEIVRSNMVHGPCGPLNPSCVCMENGRCKKRYPRRFLLETVTGEVGYPAYKRRRPAEGGFTTRLTVNSTEIEVDNRWVVPYSPVLCRALQAHINVEYCSSVKSIKYICKYVNKGSDRVSFEVTALHPNVVEATILTGVGAGEDVFIPRIPIIPSNYPFQFKRIQFPLSLCFAMTINKSQGQTLRVAGLDLRSGCFSHGQLYVACSRVSSTHSLYATANGPSTPNVVYKEVIND